MYVFNKLESPVSDLPPTPGAAPGVGRAPPIRPVEQATAVAAAAAAESFRHIPGLTSRRGIHPDSTVYLAWFSPLCTWSKTVKQRRRRWPVDR